MKTKIIMIPLMCINLITCILTLVNYYWLYIFFPAATFTISLLILEQEERLTFSLIFVAIGILYTLGPALMVLSGTMDTAYFDSHVFWIYISCVSVLFFSIGDYVGKKIKIYKSHNHNQIQNRNIHFLILCLFFILYLIGEIYIISRIGIDSYYIIGRAQTKKIIIENFKYVSMADSIGYIVNVISLDYYLSHRKEKLYLFIFIISFLSTVILAIIQVDRSSFLFAVLPVVYLLNFHKIISIRIGIYLGLLMLAFLILWKTIVPAFITGNTLNLSLNVSVPYELVSWFYIGNNIGDALEHGEIGYQNGSTYLSALESLICPIYQSYESLSTWYVRTFHSDIYSYGGGMGFSCIVESVYNFGMFGTLIFFFVGMIQKAIERNTYNSPYFRCIYALMIAFIYKFFRSEMYSIVKMSFWLYIVPIIFIWLFSEQLQCEKKRISSMGRYGESKIEQEG